MRDNIPPEMRRIGHLCANLEADSTLREELLMAGLSREDCARLVKVVREGEVGALAPLLAAVEAAAESAGVDPVTSSTRGYRPVDGLPVHTVSGWRCPHPIPCGRAEVGADQRIERRCALTGDPLQWASPTSR